VVISTNVIGKKYLSTEIKEIEKYLAILGPSPESIKDKKIRIVTDMDAKGLNMPEEGIGPILGLYNALDKMEGRHAIVTAFDMPFISYILLNTLKRYAYSLVGEEAVIIEGQKGFESLCGVYSKKFKYKLRQNINRGEFKISLSYNNSHIKIIKVEDIYPLGIDDLNFFNINKEEDLKSFFRIFYGEVGSDDAGSCNTRFIRKWKDHFYRKTYKAAKTQET
jgi:molybdopterin-guanine dinucleotide biosynthesis protein A